ncbi:MAG: hypothetical protein ACSLEW_04195 [Nocardioides sp.]
MTASIQVGATRQRRDRAGRHHTITRVEIAGQNHRLWFATPPQIAPVRGNLGDVWLPPLLLLAMHRGMDLKFHDEVSDSMLASAQKVMDLFARWYPDRFQPIEVHARTGDRLSAVPVTGSCFTGGVDSFDTLIRAGDRIDAVIYGIGLDFPRKHTEQVRRVSRAVVQIAEESGVRPVRVTTNIRDLLNGWLRWPSELHGAVLVSLGLVCSSSIGVLMIPSTDTYGPTMPWGSHPDLDPLWSTDRLQVIRHGDDLDRTEKTMRVARDPRAQRHLRVCWKARRRFNCGRCQKCLRTMAVLELADQLQQIQTFPNRVDTEILAAIDLRTDNNARFIQDILTHAESVTGHEQLKAAMRIAVDRYWAQA